MRGTGALTRGRLPILVGVLLGSLAALCSGCAVAGGNQELGSPANGDNASHRGILLRNVFVLGPKPAQTIPVGGAAPIYLTLINQNAEPDRLVSVAAPDVARSVQITGGPIALPPGAVRQPGEDGHMLILEGLTTRLNGGEYVRLIFRFAEAGTVAVSVPVMPYASFYATYPAAPTSTID